MITSRQIQLTLKLISLLGLLAFSVRTHAVTLEALPENGQTSITSEHIQVTEKQIQITVKNQPLREVLQYIQNHYGIHFSLDSSIKEAKLTATIKTNDWQKALNSLLQNHNRSAILNDTGELQQVLVLGQQRGMPPLQNAYFIPAEKTATTKPAIEDPGTADAPPGVSVENRLYHTGPPQQPEEIELGPPMTNKHENQPYLQGSQVIEHFSATNAGTRQHIAQ
jgi:hypothetical protein